VCKSGDPTGFAASAAAGPFFDTARLDECIDAYDYELPAERIAQHPAQRRDHSRLLVHHRAAGRTLHTRFDALTDHLSLGDLLVINDTRVIPARIRARRTTGAKVEILLLHPLADDVRQWEALVRPSARIRDGEEVRTLRGDAAVCVAEALPNGHRRVSLPRGLDLEDVGELPLPPYIERTGGLERTDRERYQTVYALHEGAVAAPTAGLHFTVAGLDRARERGIERAAVTLHVGVGTFEPIRCDRLDEHAMHGERFRVPPSTAAAIEQACARGGKVVAVGTTVVRTLETWDREGRPADGRWRESNLFIRPGHEFTAIDAMLTNFHLPRSTLLALVSAWADRERVLQLYEEALEAGYRFYSYGDAMLLL